MIDPRSTFLQRCRRIPIPESGENPQNEKKQRKSRRSHNHQDHSDAVIKFLDTKKKGKKNKKSFTSDAKSSSLLSSPFDDDKGLFIAIRNIQYWMVDRSKSLGGYWILTGSNSNNYNYPTTAANATNNNTTATTSYCYYRLLNPCTYRPGGGVLTSQTDLHLIPRLRLGLLSNLLDMFATMDDETVNEFCSKPSVSIQLKKFSKTIAGRVQTKMGEIPPLTWKTVIINLEQLFSSF